MIKKIKNWINRRGIEMEETAQLLGMDYSKEDTFHLHSTLNNFKLFKAGSSRKIKHILRSTQQETDPHFDVFDYQYTVNTGNSAHTVRQTVFFVQSKALDLPQLYLKPEHFAHKVAAFLGWDDIDFEHYPTFSNQYHLTGEHENTVRNMMNDDILYFFTFEKNWCMEGAGYYLLLYRKGKRFSKHEIQSFIETGMQVHSFLVQK